MKVVYWPNKIKTYKYSSLLTVAVHRVITLRHWRPDVSSLEDDRNIVWSIGRRHRNPLVKADLDNFTGQNVLSQGGLIVRLKVVNPKELSGWGLTASGLSILFHPNIQLVA